MSDVRFLSPEWAWFLPAALALVVLLRRLRTRTYLATSNLRALDPRLARPSPLRRAPAALLVAALAAVTVALMDPVRPLAESEVVSRGLDIAIVLDLSSSMQEVMDLQRKPPDMASIYTPLQPLSMRPEGRTRLEVTREVLGDFVKQRAGDRIALVVFSDNAYVVSPLTLDHEYLLRYIRMVDERILRGEGMTAIGEGLALANHLLDRQRGSERRGQVVMLLTDGEHNQGRAPFEPLQQSRAAGIKVHMVGVDLEEDIKQNESVQKLVAAVRQHGGRYLEADDERALRAAATELDSLEKGRLTTRAYVRDVPAFGVFALAAAVLVTAASALLAIPFFIELT